MKFLLSQDWIFSFFRRQKSCLQGLARRRASTKLFESPRQWGVHPQHPRPPVRPFPKTRCSLRAQNRYKMLILRYIITTFVYCNRFSGPNGVSVHVGWMIRYFAQLRFRPRARSSKYYSILYSIKSIYFSCTSFPLQDRLSPGHSQNIPNAKYLVRLLYSILKNGYSRWSVF